MEPDTIAKLIGAIGLTGALAVAVRILWLSWAEDRAAAKTAQAKLDEEREARIKRAEDRLEAERLARLADNKIAQDKLDAFQDAEIKRQGDLIRALSGKEAA